MSDEDHKIRNFTPAITNMSTDILEIGGKQPEHFRTDKFLDLMGCSQQRLLNLIGCHNGRVAFMTCSGTGAMDATVANLIDRNERVLIINGGTFGQRWVDICQAYQLNYQEFVPNFADDIDLNSLGDTIKRFRPTTMLMQATETSSMQMFPVKVVGQLCADNGIKFIVDAITSFAIDEFNMDEYNISVAILSSQKGLMLAPGLAMIILKDGLELAKNRSASFYLDLTKYFRPHYDVSIPFTPHLIAMEQLSSRLAEMEKMGMQVVVNLVAKRARLFRSMLQGLPLRLVSQTPSNCGSLLEVTRLDVDEFCIAMQKKKLHFTPYGKYNGSSEQRSNQLCISHMGNLDHADHLFFVNELNTWLGS